MFGVSAIYTLFDLQQEQVNLPLFKLNFVILLILKDLDIVSFGHVTEVFLLNRTLNFVKLSFSKSRKLQKCDGDINRL